MRLLAASFENPVKVVIHLLQVLKVPVTSSTVNEVVLSHPDYPSLLSISDALRTWKVDNVAVRADNQMLGQLNTPFITDNGNGFIVVHEVTADELTYMDASGKMAHQKLENFLQQWNGIVLITEAAGDAGEENYIVNRKKERQKQMVFPLLLSTLIILILFSSLRVLSGSSTAFGIGYILLCFCKLSGLLLTGLLLWYEVDKYSPVVQKICGGTSGKSNCNAVLNSPGARPFSFISWSELGFFYFTGGYLLLVLQPNPVMLGWISLLSLFASPYILYSIFYQWKIAKNWCPLCLGVQALLATEILIGAVSGILNNNGFNALNTVSALPGFAAHFIIPILVWYFIKPFLTKEKEARNKTYELNRLKFNTQLFSSLLLQQQPYPEDPQGLGIQLGNPAASRVIVKVCNPYCGPCAKAHPEIDRLLAADPQLKVQIIFTATTGQDDMTSLPVRHLLAIDAQHDTDLTKKALDDWYLPENKDYKSFATKYPMNGELDAQTDKIRQMRKWCDAAKIEFTPTFFFNGYKLPEIYTVNELKYFLHED